MKKMVVGVLAICALVGSISAVDAASIHESVQVGDLRRVQQLVERGADVNSHDRGGHTPLIIALMDENMEMVEYLLSRGADANRADALGYTPLLWAIGYFGNYREFPDAEMVRVLLDSGANWRRIDEYGENVLGAARSINNMRACQIIENYTRQSR